MPIADYHNSVRILPTDDWLSTCQEELGKLGVSRPLLVTSAGSVRRLRLEAHFPAKDIYSSVVPNPTMESCQKAVDLAMGNTFEGVVAVGGGSVMDTAKCIMAALGTGLTSMEELLRVKKAFPHRVPAVFVPTTHGTASEVTMWGTVWDMQKQQKYSISHPGLYPDVAILDAHLTLSLPLDISLTTTMDALSHCLESIWNKHTNDTYIAYALEAIVLVLRNAPQLKVQPDNLKVRECLLTAATTAGLAFSNTSTAAAHAISYPLTIHYSLPHGVASSISLIPLLEINGPAITKPLNTLYRKLGIGGMDELKARIRAIHEGYVKYRLRDWGVEHQQLSWLVDQCFTSDRMNNNIVNLAREQVYGILEAIF